MFTLKHNIDRKGAERRIYIYRVGGQQAKRQNTLTQTLISLKTLSYRAAFDYIRCKVAVARSQKCTLVEINTVIWLFISLDVLITMKVCATDIFAR